MARFRWGLFAEIFGTSDGSYKRYICIHCHKVICTVKSAHDPKDSLFIQEKISSHHQICKPYQRAILKNPRLKDYLSASYTIIKYRVNK